MKTFVPAACASLLSGLFLVGCASDPNKPGITNPRQPGPAAGRAVGVAVGAVGGNVAGAVVGVGEGAAAAAAKPFDNTRRVITVWHKEVTPDGRVIDVPVYMEVDKYGRPIGKVPPGAVVQPPASPGPSGPVPPPTGK